MKPQAKKKKVTLETLSEQMTGMQKDMTGMKAEISGVKADMTGVKKDMMSMEQRLGNRISDLGEKFEAKLHAVEVRLTKKIDDKVDELASSVAEGFQEVDVKIARALGGGGSVLSSAGR